MIGADGLGIQGHLVLVAHPLAQIPLFGASQHDSGVDHLSKKLVPHIFLLLPELISKKLFSSIKMASKSPSHSKRMPIYASITL